MNEHATPELAATLQRLEDARQASLRKLKLALALTAAALALAMAWAYSKAGGVGAVFCAMAGAAIAWFWTSRFLRRMRVAFKKDVMPVLLAGIDPSLRHEVEGSITEEEFERADMFIAPDTYSGKDLVFGRIGDTAVRFSLVHAQERYEETSTDSDGKTRSETRYRTIFSGLFFIADFNKHFAGRTLVKPGKAGFLHKRFGSHVALEDPEFAKLFTVNSSDQVEARYILTPSMMEKLKALRTRVGAFRVAFFQGSLYMALDLPQDAFEPAVTRSLADPQQVQKILSNLRCVTDLVEDLGLNVRIWTKAGADGQAQGRLAA